MRSAIIAALMATALMATALTGCSDKKREAAAADARAAGFVPPSVTSRLDYGSQQERRFRRLDRDSDDVLTGTEMPRTRSRLMALDRNKDGEITSSEFNEGMLARFDAMDLNRDGVVTSEERTAANEVR